MPCGSSASHCAGGTGLTDFLSVLQAQFNLFTSQDALAQNAGAIALDLVAPYKALGGGWVPVPRPNGSVSAARSLG